MRAQDLQLQSLIQFSPDDGNNLMGDQRIITIPTNALGILRQDLINTMGMDRTKGFLLRYGWNCGVSDGTKIKEMNWTSEKEMLWAGPKMYMIHGYAFTEPQITKSDFKNGKLHFEGICKNSYEAQQHIRLFGFSTEPVCHNLIGYASGYLSTIIGKKVVAKEVECEGKGDEQCRWVCKTVEEWEDEGTDALVYYEATNLADELDTMYEKLKIERDNLDKTIHVYNRLMQQFLSRNDLQSFANVVYKITNIPVLIEDDELNHVAAAGLNLQKAKLYGNVFKHWLNQTENTEDGKRKLEKLKVNKQTVEIELSYEHKRLVTPISLGQSHRGYCSFIYEAGSYKDVDALILKQLSVTCALYLFNERTAFDTEQRMRGSFLEDILSRRLTPKEIMNKANSLGVNLGNCYQIVVMDKLINCESVKIELELTDHLISKLSHYFKDININVFLAQLSGRTIMLLPTDLILQNHAEIALFLNKLLDDLKEKYPYSFKLGVSTVSSTIEEASNLYEEAIAAVKLAHYRQEISFFEDLGIVGVLFQSGNLDAIWNYCHKLIGKLLEHDKTKNIDYTKTIYFYINNGFNVYKTARDMNLSITGLRYRLQKLKEILNVDIDNPKVGYQIYMSIQVLITFGEIDIY